MPPLCPSCQHPREVGYGVECVPGDHAIFIRASDARPYFRHRCEQYQREEVAGRAQGMIAGIVNAAVRHQAALPGVA